MTHHRQRLSGIISFVSQETDMNKGRKRIFQRTLIAEENEANVSTSCLFRNGEILDFNLVPSFPNYFYAFTSLLLPAPSRNNHPLIHPQSFEPPGKSPKEIVMTAIRLIYCILCLIMVITFTVMELIALCVNTFRERRELYNYIVLPNHVLPVLMRGQLLNILMRKRKSILRVFGNPKSIGCFDEHSSYNLCMRKAFRVAKTFVYGLAIIGIVIVGTDFGSIKISDWTLFELLDANAYYIWEELSSLATESNSTAWSSFVNDSTEGMELETVVLGITGCFLNFLLFLTSVYIGGTFLFAGLTMKEVASNLVRLTKASRRNGQRILQSYEFLFQSTIRLNNEIGGLLALFHIQTFLFFELFLRSTIAGQLYWILTHMYAIFQMDEFRDWVRKIDSKEFLGVNQDTIQILLDEMKTNPNGIGKGVFYVNADLIAKIASSIGAFFLVVAPQNKPSN